MTVGQLLDIMTVETGNKITLIDLNSEARGEETELKLSPRGWSNTIAVSSYKAYAHRHVNSVHVYGKSIMIGMYGAEE